MKKILSAILTLTPAVFAGTAFINQVGYRPSDAKELALVEGTADKVDFVNNETGAVVFSAIPTESSYWAPSGDAVRRVDFSDLRTEGVYSVVQGGTVLRSDLKIAEKTYEELTKASLKWFYYQRASMALEEQYAGQWKRDAGHLDTDVKLHSSTGEEGSISSPKGWYDAGDYGKYIVNSGITTYTLLSLYEHFPEYFETLKWNIPADGALPDLLVEIKYNLDWMLTMQAKDGSVYHKLTPLDFPGDIMPASDKTVRYAIGKSSTAAYDFAAVMAVASRVYKEFDAAYATTCIEAAKKAYAWAVANHMVLFKTNPDDVSTGMYEDKNADDEKVFAATEMFITTKDVSYKVAGTSDALPGWQYVYGLATYGKVTHAADFSDESAKAMEDLKKSADLYVDNAKSGFGVPMAKDDFYWGSNGAAGNQAVWLLYAFYMTADKKYYDAARRALDYMLGKNPLDMSFVTGFGTKSPKHPHHRISTSDKVFLPIPGMIVGGPQPGQEDVGTESWSCKSYRTGMPATTYIDDRCSYATNEVAINWNAPLAYLAGAIEALNAGYLPSFANREALSVKSVNSLNGRKSAVESPAKIRFSNQKLYIEKNGKRFDMTGERIK